MPRNIFSRASTENLNSLAPTALLPQSTRCGHPYPSAIIAPILGSGLLPFKHGNASAISASYIGFFYLNSNKSYSDLTFFRPVVVGRVRAAHCPAKQQGGDEEVGGA
ncbi:MAG: hypothetical protein ACLP19_08005 [Xanthobacteraceae bacterium]